MKRILILLLALTLSITTIGCGSKENEKESGKEVIETDNQEDEGENPIEIDKKLMSVEVTIPSSLFESDDEEIDIREIKADAKEQGINDAILNDDGSITYSMSKSKHKEMMEEMKEDLIKSMDDIIADENFASIQDIVANTNFTEFDVTVDRDKFENSFDGFATMGIAFQSMFYQMFDGVDPDNYQAIINIKDKDTSEVVDTIIYPDALDE